MTIVTTVVLAVDALMLAVAALVAVVVAAAGLTMVATRNGLLLPLILVLSLLGFTSAVAVGRLIRTRRDIR